MIRGIEVAEIPINNEKSKYLREEYVARINRVIDYIEANIEKELTLEALADINLRMAPVTNFA